jgi:iron complex outermembrane recepter protein
VIGTTPLPGTGIDRDKVPANVQSLTLRSGARGLAEPDQRADRPGGQRQHQRDSRRSLSAGHPLSRLRGLAGARHAAGLAVYQNGVRVNEAFGDTVNWDLIPTSRSTASTWSARIRSMASTRWAAPRHSSR